MLVFPARTPEQAITVVKHSVHAGRRPAQHPTSEQPASVTCKHVLLEGCQTSPCGCLRYTLTQFRHSC